MKRGLLTNRMIVVGWLCGLGISLVLADVASILPYLEPEDWNPPVPGPNEFALDTMIIHCGPIGWVGGWGYLAALLWWPLTAWRFIVGFRSGAHPTVREWIVFISVPLLATALQLLVWLTPLRRASGLPVF